MKPQTNFVGFPADMQLKPVTHYMKIVSKNLCYYSCVMYIHLNDMYFFETNLKIKHAFKDLFPY